VLLSSLLLGSTGEGPGAHLDITSVRMQVFGPVALLGACSSYMVEASKSVVGRRQPLQSNRVWGGTEERRGEEWKSFSGVVQFRT